MEEPNPLENMDRVQAPPGFEGRVLAELAIRKRRLVLRRRTWRFSLVGATAIVLVGLVTLNVSLWKKPSPAAVSSLNKQFTASQVAEAMLDKTSRSQALGEAISIIEPVDYSGEIRSISHEPQTIYILEQVTEAAYSQFKY